MKSSSFFGKHLRRPSVSWSVVGTNVGGLYCKKIGKRFKVRVTVFPWKSKMVLVSILTTSRWWVARKAAPMWANMRKKIDLAEPTPWIDHVYLSCTQWAAAIDEETISIKTQKFQRITTSKVEEVPKKKRTTTLRRSHPRVKSQCMGRYGKLANKCAFQLQQAATLCIDDDQLKEEDYDVVGDSVVAQILLTCLYLARIGRPDILWTVNTIARAVTMPRKPEIAD